VQTETTVTVEHLSRAVLYLCEDHVSRQKEMQHQLQKITDLIRSIVLKMNIVTETEMDYTFDRPKIASHARMKKFQQVFQASRRFTSSESSREG
jgi:hypothetical protein